MPNLDALGFFALVGLAAFFLAVLLGPMAVGWGLASLIADDGLWAIWRWTSVLWGIAVAAFFGSAFFYRR